jgi:hypothetical protein
MEGLMNILKKLLFVVLAVTVSGVGVAHSTPLDYNLNQISGSWAWGNTEWNALFPLGYVNNSTDVSTVNNMIKGPYTYQPAGSQIANGIYNFPYGASSLTFSMTGGDQLVNSLSILSSRSYSPYTVVTLGYSADGGTTWNNALTTTTGALGWNDVGTGGMATETITLGAGVYGDEFKLAFNGDQISIHSVFFDGSSSAAPVPEPGTIALLGLGMAGLAVYGKRRKNSKA